VGEEETDVLKIELEKRAKLPNNRIIIDFSEVTYFSSLALGILVKEDEIYTHKGGRIVICNVPDFLENIFVLTKLTNILNIIRTLDEAEREILI
jgi:anti-anti-sigma factor